MPNELIFFCCACFILLLTIINLSVGPIVSGAVGSDWGLENCAFKEDEYDDEKKSISPPNDIRKKYYHEWRIDECKREKGMYDMEYTSFIFDIAIGFVCGLLGLLHLFGAGKDFKNKTGIIGLGCGIVGFILTFVYVILNGIVYTNYYDDSTIYKTDSDGVFAEWEDGRGYKCTYFDEEGNNHAIIAKYSDLNKKQYNYDKDMQFDRPNEFSVCGGNPASCYINGYISAASPNSCKKLYYDNQMTTTKNKDKSDRFLTTLLLSLFVCLANIGLAIFGFLLFKSSGDFTKVVEVKA